MSRLLSGLRDRYGSGPLHLLTMATGFALLGYLLVTATPATLWKPADGVWWKSMAVWFAAAIIAHDLLLFPIYSLADRLLGIPASRRRQHRVPARNYLRVPALGSGLLLLIFFPGIIRQDASLYFEDTGLTQQPFLGRWLLITAAMFAAGAVAYATRLAITHLHKTPSAGSAKQ